MKLQDIISENAWKTILDLGFKSKTMYQSRIFLKTTRQTYLIFNFLQKSKNVLLFKYDQ